MKNVKMSEDEANVLLSILNLLHLGAPDEIEDEMVNFLDSLNNRIRRAFNFQ